LIVDELETVAEIGDAISGIPGPVGTVGSILSIVFSTASVLVKAGKDPVEEIKRIHKADPLVRQVHRDWDDAMDERWPLA
jgi:hypothetical protein